MVKMLQNKKRMKNTHPDINEDVIDDNINDNNDDNNVDDESTNSIVDDEVLDDDKDANNKANDGLADMMNRILHQNIGSKINPVLAKRKTSMMKEIETDTKDNNILKKLKKENKIDRNKQMVIPEHTTIDFERQLRKLATRGVVALFNAIAKAKREDDPTTKKNNNSSDDDEDKKKNKKSSKNNKDKIVLSNAKSTTNITSNNNNKNKASNDVGNTNSNKWAAVKDDYMIGSNLTVKNWDKSIESDSDNE